MQTGDTALMMAVDFDRLEAVRNLLMAKVNSLEIQNKVGAWFEAMGMAGHSEVAVQYVALQDADTALMHVIFAKTGRLYGSNES